MFSLLIFSGTFLYLSNWFQIHTFTRHLLSPREKITTVINPEISELIKRKTGVTIKRITVFNSDKIFGMMAGTPLRPLLILSSRLLKELNKDELEWVLLHEAGHSKLWHNLKCAIIQLMILSIGIMVINRFSLSILFSILLGLVFGLISIRCMRFFEREADTFSINRVDNPEGVITAQEKLALINRGTTRDDNGLVRKILHWNIMPEERIRITKKLIAERTQITI